MLAEVFLLIRGAGLWNKIRSIRSMETGVVSAGFVTDKVARKESEQIENSPPHRHMHIHAQTDTYFEHTDLPRQTYMGLCSDTESLLQMPVDTS